MINGGGEVVSVGQVISTHLTNIRLGDPLQKGEKEEKSIVGKGEERGKENAKAGRGEGSNGEGKLIGRQIRGK